jgi:hypothetical protein
MVGRDLEGALISASGSRCAHWKQGIVFTNTRPLFLVRVATSHADACSDVCALVDAKTRRAVKYTKTLELWESSQAQRRLPVQWKMWLTHTRSQPPTPEVR